MRLRHATIARFEITSQPCNVPATPTPTQPGNVPIPLRLHLPCKHSDWSSQIRRTQARSAFTRDLSIDCRPASDGGAQDARTETLVIPCNALRTQQCYMSQLMRAASPETLCYVSESKDTQTARSRRTQEPKQPKRRNQNNSKS